MIKIGLSSLKQSLASQTGFLLITTVTGYAFAYLYLLVMGRLLGPETFGILGALFSIFYIACLIGQALREAITTNVAEVRTKSSKNSQKVLIIFTISDISVLVIE